MCYVYIPLVLHFQEFYTFLCSKNYIVERSYLFHSLSYSGTNLLQCPSSTAHLKYLKSQKVIFMMAHCSVQFHIIQRTFK